MSEEPFYLLVDVHNHRHFFIVLTDGHRQEIEDRKLAKLDLIGSRRCVWAAGLNGVELSFLLADARKRVEEELWQELVSFE